MGLGITPFLGLDTLQVLVGQSLALRLEDTDPELIAKSPRSAFFQTLLPPSLTRASLVCYWKLTFLSLRFLSFVK